jgi:hypothetical protein
MVDLITNKMRIGPQLTRLILVFLGTEINDRRNIFPLHEAPQYIDTIALAVATAQQNEIVSGARELVGPRRADALPRSGRRQR